MNTIRIDRFKYIPILVCLLSVLLTGCPDPLRDILAVSTEFQQDPILDFGVSPNILSFQVWVKESVTTPINISITPQQNWILVEPGLVASTGPANRQTVSVGIDRSKLGIGTHIGNIRVSAPGASQKTVPVRVIQEEDGNTQGELNITNASNRYTTPYLLEFDFFLTDGEGDVVVAEPAAFAVTAYEDLTEVNPQETGVYLKRGATRPMKMELVLDYSLSMQLVPNAILQMQAVCTDLLLPALNEDAQVGITEFHRDDLEPARVSPFTVDRLFLEERIEAIQTEYVSGFASGSRMWDAVYSAVERFDVENENHEARVILLITDGNDTSSVKTLDDVVEAAKKRGVLIYAVGFGLNINRAQLSNLATRTQGTYFDSTSLIALENAIHHLNDILQSQYNLRWASLRRSAAPIVPRFHLSLNGNSAQYTAAETFVPIANAGDVLKGKLILERSDSGNNTTVFLRANYIPRLIDRLNIYIESDYEYTVEVVDGINDGLLANWVMDIVPVSIGNSLNLTGPILPFATFGPMLRFDFDSVLATDDIPFKAFQVDNSIYGNAQYFEIEESN